MNNGISFMKKIAVFSLVFVFSSVFLYNTQSTKVQLVEAAAWTPPIGIPAPPFWINKTAPAAPNPWTSAVAGFYYVESTNSAATDTNNPYGTPAKPRFTIPYDLPAGAVIELHGNYTWNHTSPGRVNAAGTANAPVFVRGADGASKPKVWRGWDVQGSYIIIENIEFSDNPNSSVEYEVGKVTINAHNVAVRNSIISGNLNGGGMGISNASNVVVSNNVFRDIGDVNANYDQDRHCISVGNGTNNLWVVDNELARCSGDGIQVNGNTATSVHHVYVGRNKSHGHKQTGMWTKSATDVIFSQNTIYNIRPSGSSGGQCTGAQYGPDYVWWLYNHLYDCESGIHTEGDSGFGVSNPHFFVIGNVIHDVNNSDAGDPGNPHASGGIVFRGATERYVINNTLWNYQAGIMTPSGGFIQIENNILANRTNPQGRDIYIEIGSTANASTLKNNIIYGSPVRITWGSGSSGPVYDLAGFQAATGKGQNSLNTNPLFLGAGNYILQASSPAINTGLLHNAYQIFSNRYGIDIAKDFNGASRPAGGAWDIGAYEYGGIVVNPTPTPTPTPVVTPAPACTLYTTSSTIPTGFASPYDVVNNPNQSLMNASCTTNGTQPITLGNGSQSTYIYKTGYVLRNNAWQQVNYTGQNLLYSNWYAGNASGSLNLTQAELSQGAYFLSYQCQWTGSVWKCGCRTSACTGADGNKWQIQFIKE
jgi:hypothetical protein